MHKKINLIDKDLFEKLINLYNSGNYKELEEKLILLIKTNPRSYSLFNLLGAVKKSLKDYVGSKIAFKKAINIQNNIASSEINNIQNGMRVKHSKFGSGKILEISGENINKKATIFFEGIGQKQLLLRFAKLEIIKE